MTWVRWATLWHRKAPAVQGEPARTECGRLIPVEHDEQMTPPTMTFTCHVCGV